MLIPLQRESVYCYRFFNQQPYIKLVRLEYCYYGGNQELQQKYLIGRIPFKLLMHLHKTDYDCMR